MGSSESRFPFEDRRSRPTPAISPYLFWGRRREPGGASGRDLYVDRPQKSAWQSSLLLFCLSVLDARLSLLLFSEGRLHEANPILFLGLLYGDHVFLAIKFLLTGFSIFVLLLHWNFSIGRGTVRVAWLLWTMIIGYVMIVLYELILLTH